MNSTSEYLKTGEERNSFLSELQKRGIEKTLESELGMHLNRRKQKRSYDEYFRNDSIRKPIKSHFGETEIAAPRNRNNSFDPILLRRTQ